MTPLRRLGLGDQVASLLTEAIQAGRWGGTLPGVNRLSETFDVSRETVRAALRILESRGVIAASGAGRSRMISKTRSTTEIRRKLRVALLLNAPLVKENADMQRTLLQIQLAIVEEGHECFFPAKSQENLGHNLKRITRFVQATPADAWVVFAASREVLEWFGAQTFPTVALGGRSVGLPIAGASINFLPAVQEAARKLLALGHRRIVLIGPKRWRHPTPGVIIQAFNAELVAHGITPGKYYTPDWEETPEGMRALLRSLFHITPPTAILVEEPAHSVAVSAFIGHRGLLIGRDVSVLCMVPEPAFAWRYPPMAHFRWDNNRLIRRIVRWVRTTARGSTDQKQISFPAEFVPGGTVMAAPSQKPAGKIRNA